MKMELFECHGHIMMNGTGRYTDVSGGYLLAEPIAQAALLELAKSGVRYFRDGGDKYGASVCASRIAQEYGIKYVTPAFAIYKEGRYGGIVGRSYGSVTEYRDLIAQARKIGADFIKLMMSGLMTFEAQGELSCPPLSHDEIALLVRIAHDEGFRVMAHVNGSGTIKSALEAGTDSIEHGYFIDDECIALLVDTSAVWVPTLSPVAAASSLSGTSGLVAGEILRQQKKDIRTAFSKGALIACGSDSGAYGVPHGAGTVTEYELLREASGASDELFDIKLSSANNKIRDTFIAK